jgi:hypothetical protein
MVAPDVSYPTIEIHPSRTVSWALGLRMGRHLVWVPAIVVSCGVVGNFVQDPNTASTPTDHTGDTGPDVSSADSHGTDPDTDTDPNTDTDTDPTRLPAWSQLTLPSGAPVFSLDDAGDVDGDGFVDVLAGQVEAGSGGEVWLLHGSPGGLERPVRVWAGAPGERAGWAVAGGVDVSGDGVPDAVIGVPSPSGGYAVVIELAGLTVIATMEAPAQAVGFGAALDLADDAGTSRIAVGAPGDAEHGHVWIYVAAADVPTAHIAGEASEAEGHWSYRGTPDGFGFRVAFGQVDADPALDLVVFARNDWGEKNGVSNAVDHVYPAGAVGEIRESDARWLVPWWCQGWPSDPVDLDGDGRDELVGSMWSCGVGVLPSYSVRAADSEGYLALASAAESYPGRLALFEEAARTWRVAYVGVSTLAAPPFSGRLDICPTLEFRLSVDVSCETIDDPVPIAWSLQGVGDVDGDELRDAVVGMAGRVLLF